MVEVFKTNVEDPADTGWLLELIHQAFAGCRANFDLDDRDRVLRVNIQTAGTEAADITDLLKAFGFWGEVLPDEIPAINNQGLQHYQVVQRQL